MGAAPPDRCSPAASGLPPVSPGWKTHLPPDTDLPHVPEPASSPTAQGPLPTFSPPPSLDPVQMPLGSKAPCLSSPPPRASLRWHRPPHPHSGSAAGSPGPWPPTVSTSPWACRRQDPGCGRAPLPPPHPRPPPFSGSPQALLPREPPPTHARDCLTLCENFSNLQKSQKTAV